MYFQDDTYSRTCDLQSVDSVFGADIYCHKNCIRSYILNYDREFNKKKRKYEPSKKLSIFEDMLSDIDPKLHEGEGFTLSSLRNIANEKMSERSSVSSFTNREIQILLLDHYGECLHLSYPQKANQSVMCFLNTVNVEDMAETIRSKDDDETLKKMIPYMHVQSFFDLSYLQLILI